jgi:hypothetical protein
MRGKKVSLKELGCEGMNWIQVTRSQRWVLVNDTKYHIAFTFTTKQSVFSFVLMVEIEMITVCLMNLICCFSVALLSTMMRCTQDGSLDDAVSHYKQTPSIGIGNIAEKLF